jgi:hypothetical protein
VAEVFDLVDVKAGELNLACRVAGGVAAAEHAGPEGRLDRALPEDEATSTR